MVDLAPEGCFSLRDFFDAFTSWKWNTDDVIGELGLEDRIAPLPDERRSLHRAGLSKVTDESLDEAVRLFALGELQAFILLPGVSERRVISQRAWAEAFFPERFFLDADVEAGHGREFESAVGRTLFVSRASASTYFSANKSERAGSASSLALRDVVIGLVMDGVARAAEAEEFGRLWGLWPMQERPSSALFDPRRVVAWTLPMALSWIVFRNYLSVREAIDEYRANWWVWVGLHRRLPLRGGAEWYEVNGAELRTREPLTMFEMGLLEALTQQEEDGRVEISVKQARTELWARLSEGRLIASGINPEGAVVQIPPHEWPYLALEADRGLVDRLVVPNGRHQAAYEKVTVRQSDVVSLWEGNPEFPDVPLMSHLADQPTWTFLEAATWVGCKGRELPSRQIADEDLEERGAYALFKALFPEQGLLASGLNRKRLREPIPAGYWEMATMDPGKFRERHYVSFIDDILHGYGGQLTPVGEENPRWFGIRLDRDAMFAAFPEIAASFAPQAEDQATTDASGGRKLAVAREAIRTLYPRGSPKGLTEKELLATVNKWLRESGNSEISPRTLARAKAA